MHVSTESNKHFHPTMIFQFQLIAVSWSLRRLLHCGRRWCQLIYLVLFALCVADTHTHTTTTLNFLESILFSEIEIESTCKYRKPIWMRASASAVFFCCCCCCCRRCFGYCNLRHTNCTTNYFYLIKQRKALLKLLALVSPNFCSTCKTTEEYISSERQIIGVLESTRRQKWKEIDLVWNFGKRE